MKLTFILLSLVTTTASAYAVIDFDLMHTKPECAHPGKESSWCTPADRARVARDSGMETWVNQMLDRALTVRDARITIAYFSFSNTSVFNKLCQIGKSGIPVEGFFDSSENKTESFATRLRACQGTQGNNVWVHFLGTKTPWRLHHNKFLIVETGAGAPIQMGFSSGNLSESGLSLHFDHWVFVNAPRNSNLMKQQFCVITALKKAIDPSGSGTDAASDNPRIYRQTLDQCLASQKALGTETALLKERIAPLFAPDPTDSIAETLIGQIQKVVPGGSVRGAVQHFLHAGIAKALQDAVKRGVKVSMLMDDDVLLEETVPGARNFFDRWLDPAISGIEVGFIQTNSETHQMMHNKFLILTGVGQKDVIRVFSGAGHFTKAATLNNYENFYLTQDAGLTSQYEELFEYMSKRRLLKDQVLH